jgi:lipopolysaccharide/colanic/teichoic acid biosynthesis glycosyltransferase
MALLSLGLLSPLLVGLAVALKLESAGPVFHCQERLGIKGQPFRIWKFRSMVHRPLRIPGETLMGDPEITCVGGWLRRFRLDELPNLFNVVTGDLALVGPRPCLSVHHDPEDVHCARRLEILPGCTGLAVAQGGQRLPWADRWRYDAWYVEHRGLAMDLGILFRSLALMLLGDEARICRFGEFLAQRKGTEQVAMALEPEQAAK